MSIKIKKGDRVRVMRGAEMDKDKIGEVIRVHTKNNRVTVQGVNLAKRHQKQRQEDGKTLPAGIVEFEAPIDVSNVMLVDAKGEKIAKDRSARRTAKANLETKSRKAVAPAKKAVAAAAEKAPAKPAAKAATKPAAKPAAKAAAKPAAKSAAKKTADKPAAKKATTAKPATKKTETKTAATKPAAKKAAAKPATKTSEK
ncbi:MAG TPA: 50S ribosomal protein L24 [Anaerolineaceae bacterium]|nr:50S ribosomal protein L24 [Anaerolineaceae bacterium]